MLKLMLITNDPVAARVAVDSGVDKIFVDLEVLGKFERQGHLDTLISRHTVADVACVRAAVPGSTLVVRTNPMHGGIRAEIESVLAAGADQLMLPMFRDPGEVEEFSRYVAGRAGVIPLVETAAAAAECEAVTRIPGVEEIYIGLNDLHRDLGLHFIFEPVASGLVDRLAAIARERKLPFGFGGIARMDEGELPGHLVLAEHIRTGSSSVILSRTFNRPEADGPPMFSGRIFAEEVRKLRAAESVYRSSSAEQLDKAHREATAVIMKIAESHRARRAGAPDYSEVN